MRLFVRPNDKSKDMCWYSNVPLLSARSHAVSTQIEGALTGPQLFLNIERHHVGTLCAVKS
jgi:hypothetical protein